MSLKQINLKYDARLDRLLLRLSTSDDKLAQLYLTRRVVKAWTRPMEQRLAQLAAVETADVLQRRERLAFDHEAASQDCDLGRQFKPGSEVVTGQEPALVVEMVFLKAKTPDATSLGFKLQQGGNMVITLEKGDLHGFVTLLNNAVAASGWDLPAIAAPASSSAPTRAALH